MPKPHEFLSAEQRDGSTLQAEEIYTGNLEMVKEGGVCGEGVKPPYRTFPSMRMTLLPWRKTSGNATPRSQKL